MKKLSLFCLLPALLTACDKTNDPVATKPGILINGVYWSENYVDLPGTFAASPVSPGMFYQWNRRTGWNCTDPMEASDGGMTWNATVAQGDGWASENDPCPDGWRLPTMAELGKLCDKENVSNEWFDAAGTIPAGRLFTDKTTGNSLRLYAFGFRHEDDGKLGFVGTFGYLWSNESYSATDGCNLNFGPGGIEPAGHFDRGIAFSIRCVADRS